MTKHDAAKNALDAKKRRSAKPARPKSQTSETVRDRRVEIQGVKRERPEGGRSAVLDYPDFLEVGAIRSPDRRD